MPETVTAFVAIGNSDDKLTQASWALYTTAIDDIADIWADEIHGRWWYGDNDIDMKARRLGGTLLIPGQPPLNRYANSTTTGILAEQAGKDRATFEAIYGPVPW